MIWRSIQYDFPQAAWLLFFVGLIIGGSFFVFYYRQTALRNFAKQLVLDRLVEPRSLFFFWLKSLLCGLIWVFAVLALMQPKGNERYVKDSAQQIEKNIRHQMKNEVIFLLDVSASMTVVDGYGGKSRLDIAKEIIDDVMSQLNGQSVSLFAYTSSTLQIVPSTTDYLFMRMMLKQLEFNEGETSGSDIKQALDDTRNLIEKMPVKTPKTLILISDGGDNRYEEKGSGGDSYLETLIKPIQDNLKSTVYFFVVGVGSKEGKAIPKVIYQGQSVISSLDEGLLKSLVQAGQGELLLDQKMSPLQIAKTIYEEIANSSLTVNKEEISISHPPIYDYYFQKPLGLALFAFFLFMIIPDTRQRRKILSKNQNQQG